ncbi:MAG TPA: iron ABC transporter permease [Longimicrobium sp.]|nr:iron ABC transporter permease [Longimicrobium sp.]
MKPALRLVLMAAAVLAAIVVGVRVGAVPLSTREVVDGVRGIGDPTTVSIVQKLRLPRTILAALVGGSLAASGAAFQALLRNPLAEPFILGVSGGAAVGAATAIVLTGALASSGIVSVSALIGALAAIVFVMRVGTSVGRTLDTRVLLLAGVVAGAFFNACIMLILTFARTESFRAAIFWMMGSFGGATWRSIGALSIAVVPAMLILFALSRPLNLLAIGEETAAYLGVRTERVKLIAYGTASLLTAASVAASGVIGFVGLVIPHVARMMWGADHRFLLPASVLLGATFIVLADALARTVAAPTELPIGVVTAFVGVPFFLWLLRRRGA